MGEREKLIGQILREMELVQEPQIQEALAIQADQGGVLGQILVDLGHASEEHVLRALAAQVGMTMVDLTQIPREDVQRTFRWLKGERIHFDVPVSAERGPRVRLVDMILTTALDAEATEIRFEYLPDRFEIRYRVDGNYYEMEAPPRHLAPPLMDRVRELTGLSTAERDERRLRAVFAGRRFGVEATSLRTSSGASIHLRFTPAWGA